MSALKLMLPVTLTEPIWPVADGQLLPSGLEAEPVAQDAMTFHVPTTLPAHGATLPQLPELLLLLLLHAPAVTAAANHVLAIPRRCKK